MSVKSTVTSSTKSKSLINELNEATTTVNKAPSTTTTQPVGSVYTTKFNFKYTYKRKNNNEKKKKRNKKSKTRKIKTKQQSMRRYVFNLTTDQEQDNEDEPIDYSDEIQANQEKNEKISAYVPEWGESDRIQCRHGHNLEITNKNNSLRMYFQNFNGINLNNEGTEFLDELTVLKELEVDILMAAETNINWTKEDSYDTTKALLSKVWKKNKLVTSNCKENTSTKFQPGGTCTVSTNKWVSHVADSGQDIAGRWSWITQRGQNNRLVTFITAYRVCDANLSTAGPSTCWMQQWRHLKKRGVSKPDPRKQFCTDLGKFIEKLYAEDHAIVLALDANEDLMEKSQLHDFINKYDLVDAYKHVHPNAQSPSTYLRGNRRLDYLFVTPDILPSITRIGYLPFQLGIFSDHCALYADFDPITLFHGDILNPLDSASRKLRSSNPKRVDNYIRLLEQLFEEHNIPKRVEALSTAFKLKLYPLTKCVDLYEKLDRQITEFMLRAEERCCKGKHGYAWSLELVEAGRAVRYWKLRKSNLLNKDQCDTSSLAEFLNIEETHCSVSELDTKITNARKHLKSVQKNAQEIRDNYLEELASMQQHKFNCGVESIIKNIKHCEELRRAFSQIGPIAKEATGGSVTTIKVPTTSRIGNNAMYTEAIDSLQFEHTEPFVTIDDSDEIMSRLIQRNKLHLHQAFDTPFAQPEMESLIGEFGTAQGAKDILDGKFDPNKINNLPEVNYWIQHHLKRVATENSIDVTLTLDEYKSLFKGQTEGTSSSPSGRHYGHYKAAISSDIIAQVHCTMMTLPFQYGFTPLRWVKAIDVMLEKDPGDPKIHRLRIIVIVEGDMNSIMKVIWNRRLVPVADNSPMASPVQFGNSRGRTALDALLLKIVTMDSIRLFRLNGALLNNDATACYDRMIPSVTSLHLQSLGMSKEAVKCSVLLNQNMKHFIKTASGVSTEYYKHSHDYGKFGEGQGKSSSPPNWKFTSSTLLNALVKLTEESYFASVCKNHISTRIAEGYVDDVDGYQVRQDKQNTITTREITNNMEKLTQTWANLLYGSGGNLSLSKSSWYLLWWKWKNGRASLSTTDEVEGDIIVRDASTSESAVLTRNEPTDSLRQLGVLTNPAGNFDDELNKRIASSRGMAQRIKRSYISRKNAWRIYRNIWLPAGQYPLTVTSWTENQCEKIMSPFLGALLPKLGINRNMPRAVIHGSHDFGGLQIAHFFVEQGYLGIKHLIGHLRENLITGTHIQIALSKMQLISGCALEYLGSTEFNLNYVPDSWLKGVRRFLKYCNGTIKVPNLWLPAPQREGDQVLMDAFRDMKASDNELDHINMVRLFLQVLTLADICTDSGTEIEAWALNGITQATASIPWPYQAMPGKTSWRIWRKYLKLTFSTATSKNARVNKNWKLDESLGEWTITEPYTLRNSYYSKSSKTLHVRKDGVFNEYSMIPGYITRFTRTTSPPTATPPAHSKLTTYKDEESHLLCLEEIDSLLSCHRSDDSPSTFSEFLQSSPEYMKRSLGSILDLDIDADYWYEALKQKRVTIASDGSVNKCRGSFAVIFYTAEKELRFQGPVDCDPTLIQSYRAELSGLLACYYFLHCLVTFKQCDSDFKPTIHIDNSAAVRANNKAFPPVGVTAHTAADSDILLEIQRLKNLGISLQAEWVEAHQDTKHPDRTLDVPAQLNCIVDADASEYIKNNETLKTPPHFPGAGAILTVDEVVVTNNLQSIIRNSSSISNIRKYIQRKTGWTNTQFDEISWTAHGKAFQSLDLNKQIKVMKFLHNWLPTNDRLHQFALHEPDLCAACKKEKETWRHLFQCSDDLMISAKLKAVGSFRQHLIKQKTNPILRATLVYQVSRWLQLQCTPPSLPTDKIGSLLNEAMHKHNDMGWENLLKGRLVNEWRQAQTIHHSTFFPTSTKHAPTVWEKQVILGLWDLALAIWEARNYILHKSDALSESDSVLNVQIDSAYSTLQHNMSSFDSALFTKTITERKNTTAQSKKFWLEAVNIAVHDFLVIHKRHPTQNTITSYFTPQSSCE